MAFHIGQLLFVAPWRSLTISNIKVSDLIVDCTVPLSKFSCVSVSNTFVLLLITFNIVAIEEFNPSEAINSWMSTRFDGTAARCPRRLRLMEGQQKEGGIALLEAMNDEDEADSEMKGDDSDHDVFSDYESDFSDCDEIQDFDLEVDEDM